jgi:hypothetical protein
MGIEAQPSVENRAELGSDVVGSRDAVESAKAILDGIQFRLGKRFLSVDVALDVWRDGQASHVVLLPFVRRDGTEIHRRKRDIEIGGIFGGSGAGNDSPEESSSGLLIHIQEVGAASLTDSFITRA